MPFSFNWSLINSNIRNWLPRYRVGKLCYTWEKHPGRGTPNIPAGPDQLLREMASIYVWDCLLLRAL